MTQDYPDTFPIFPLAGVLLLPRGHLPLNIFEPRYKQMIDDVLAKKPRVVGMIQPKTSARTAPNVTQDGAHELFSTGCLGRIISFAEVDNSNYIITLRGISRFHVEKELTSTTPYRQVRVNYAAYKNDRQVGFNQEKVNRDKLLEVLKRYLQAHSLQADWQRIKKSSNEDLVNYLSIMSPFGVHEKQTLLEAKSLEERNRILIALTEMALVSRPDDNTSMQ